MKIIYKLTDKNLQTHNGYQWKIGEWNETSGTGPLCSSGWLHCYDHPVKAVLFNQTYASFHNPKLFRGEADGTCLADGPMKLGYSRMRILEEIHPPVISLEKRIEFAIRAALQVYQEPTFVAWAVKWLGGRDRDDAEAAGARSAAWSAAAGARCASRCIPSKTWQRCGWAY